MPKALTAAEVATVTKDGMHRCDSSLYLQVRNGGANKSWLLRYRLHGRVRWMGLGPYPLFGLTEAKRRAVKHRQLLADGIDPIDTRRRERAREGMINFEQATDRYIAAHKSSWSAGHGDAWHAQLKLHAFPIIGKLAVDHIDSNRIVRVVEPLWATRSTTAGKVRLRIERILDWSAYAGFRSGPNPAAWKGGLEHRLPPLGRELKTVTPKSPCDVKRPTDEYP
jgi:hypothetical protein